MEMTQTAPEQTFVLSRRDGTWERVWLLTEDRYEELKVAKRELDDLRKIIAKVS